jgi:hypothetical protein
VLLVLALYLVVNYVLGQTTWGRHVFAVGDDIDAARLAGIRINRVLFSVYAVAGLIIAVGAWVSIGYTGAASPNNAVDANLQSINAVVIGGTSLFGGRGGVIGTLFGALIVVVFTSGLTLANVNGLYQQIAEGILPPGGHAHRDNQRANLEADAERHADPRGARPGQDVGTRDRARRSRPPTGRWGGARDHRRQTEPASRR